jgi:methionine-rich copper-binding protein CopC
MRRAGLLLAFVLTGILGTAPAAFAHNSLVSSDPADKTSLTTGPSTVTLTFDQPIQQGFNTISIVGPGQTRWETASFAVNGNAVTADVRPLGPVGEYSIGYRVLSADGHPVSGAVKVTLTAAGTGSPAPPAADGSDSASADDPSGGSIPVWVWIVGALAVLGVGLVLALRMGGKEEV